MPTKKAGMHIKDLIGKEIMMLSKLEKEAEGPYTLLGVEAPMICILSKSHNRSFWFNLSYIVSIAEVLDAQQQ